MKNTKWTRFLSLLLAVFMLFGCILPLASCGEDTPDEPDQGEQPGGDTPDGGDGSPVTYTVSVKSAYGMPLEDVMIYIHEGTDPNKYNSVARDEVDKNGMATFSLEGGKTYSVELSGVPDGYKVEKRYTFDASRFANIELHSAPITDEDFEDVDYYEVGDVIHDFTLTDVNGKTWKVSDVLKEQQLLVLNFWYTTCSWCIKEFPYMLQAYENYNSVHGTGGKNIVEIFAINDYGDSKAAIKGFTVSYVDEFGQTVSSPLSFPTFKAEESGFGINSMVSKFSGVGYPISVFIDRAGVICCIEEGAVVSDKPFINAFDHFTAANYKQKLVKGIDEFTPISEPNVDAPSSEEIDAALTGNYRDSGNKIQVSYRFDENKFNWPYIVTEFAGETCLRPSNRDIDNSYAILYADVYLEEGDAVAFEYFSSSQNTLSNSDDLVVIVNGKNIYSIHGFDRSVADGETVDWSTCFAYVAQYSGTYEIAFAYLKDEAGYMGEDAVFIKNLHVVDNSEVDVESYIFRYAAEVEIDGGAGYSHYATVVYNPADGYYHVGSENGPLLLAQLVDVYSRFDSNKTVFERFYANTNALGEPEFIIDGVDYAESMIRYGTYASNSDIVGHTPVTAELAMFLKAHVEKYRRDAGKTAHEDLWLQLCCYYDAYGTNGKQLRDPIKGLSTFSAYEAELETKLDVTYDKVVVPRGYLYKFVPTVSGVYKIISDSDKSVIGWIFKGDQAALDGKAGLRIEYVNSENSTERFDHELVFEGYSIVCDECGKTTTFEKQFENGVEVVVTSVNCADPLCNHLITDLSAKEAVTSLDYMNISMSAFMEAGKPYYIAVAFHDVEELGSLSFEIKFVGEQASLFTAVSPGPFTFDTPDGSTIGETIAGGKKVKLCDRAECAECAAAALAGGAAGGTKYYHVINSDGSLGSVIYADFYMYTDIFENKSLADIHALGGFDFSDAPTRSEEDEEAILYLQTLLTVGKDALYASWGTGMTTEEKEEVWLSYCMDEVLKGNYRGLEGEDNSEALIAQAEEWAELVMNAGKAYLKTLDKWSSDFDYWWSYYKMDDIILGIYHGPAYDYTEIIGEYIDNMLDEADHPERQGCVAVDEELGKILQILMDVYTFEGVENSFVKLCYYYEPLYAEKYPYFD